MEKADHHAAAAISSIRDGTSSRRKQAGRWPTTRQRDRRVHRSCRTTWANVRSSPSLPCRFDLIFTMWHELPGEACSASPSVKPGASRAKFQPPHWSFHGDPLWFLTGLFVFRSDRPWERTGNTYCRGMRGITATGVRHRGDEGAQRTGATADHPVAGRLRRIGIGKPMATLQLEEKHESCSNSQLPGNTTSLSDSTVVYGRELLMGQDAHSDGEADVLGSPPIETGRPLLITQTAHTSITGTDPAVHILRAIKPCAIAGSLAT